MDAPQKLMAAIALAVGLAGSALGQVRRESLEIPPEPVPMPLPSREPGDDASDLGTNREQAARPDARPGVTSLTIADLEEMALGHNPTIAQAARHVAALEGKHLQSGLRPNPTVGYLGEEMGDEGSAGQQGIFIEQRLVTGGKLSLNRAVVSHEIQRAQQSLEMQRLRVLTDVRSRAYGVLIAQRTVELQQRLSQIGDDGIRAATELFGAKEVGRVDVLRARVEANSAKLQLNNARNDYTAAWRQLALTVGVPEMQPTPLVGEGTEKPPTLTWDQAVQHLLSASPELARAWAGVERAKCALARAQAGRKPDVNVGASVRYNDASESTTAGIVVGVPLQIFDRNQGTILRANSELMAAHREVQRVELALQDRLTGVFRQYENAREQVEQYEKDILPDAKSTLELVQAGYQQGEFGYIEFLSAQRTYTRVNIDYLQSLRELRQSGAQMEGLLLSGGLTTPAS